MYFTYNWYQRQDLQVCVTNETKKKTDENSTNQSSYLSLIWHALLCYLSVHFAEINYFGNIWKNIFVSTLNKAMQNKSQTLNVFLLYILYMKVGATCLTTKSPEKLCFGNTFVWVFVILFGPCQFISYAVCYLNFL